VLHHSVIKVLTSKVGVSSSGLHLKDIPFNSKQGDIKSTTTQVKHSSQQQ
jgi:hypothetical protein